MGDIQVIKKENSWTVSTDNGAYNVKDTNGNGKIDSGDIWTALNGQEPPTTQEKEEAMGLSLKKENMTGAEIDEYNRVQEQLKKKKEIKERLEQQQRATQYSSGQYGQYGQSSKASKWAKIGQICTMALAPLTLVGGVLSSAGVGSWAYNGCGNDRALKWFGGITGGLFGLSALGSMIGMFAQKNNTYSYTPAMNTNNYGNMFQQAIQAQQQYDQQKMQEWEEYSQKMQEQAEEQKIEKEKQQNTALVTKTIEDANADGAVCEKTNKEYLNTLEDLDGEREYTAEEIKKVKQIRQTPMIPVKHIGEDATDKTKLSPKFAKLLNDKLSKYEKLDEEGSDNKFKVFTKEQYNSVKSILAKTQLTEADITNLKKIYKESEKIEQ